VCWSVTPELYGADDPHAVARTVDEVRFIAGSMQCPPVAVGPADHAVTQLSVPGQTHWEIYLFWRLMEPERDQWDFQALTELDEATSKAGMKVQAFPWVQFAPKWFQETDDYVQLEDMQTGAKVDLLSPWAPGSYVAVDHFYAGLAKHAKDAIDIISIGSVSSDYGEVGLVLGTKDMIPGKGRWPADHFPQVEENWHQGYWCGDAYARADFRTWSLKRHRSLKGLNQA